MKKGIRRAYAIVSPVQRVPPCGSTLHPSDAVQETGRRERHPEVGSVLSDQTGAFK